MRKIFLICIVSLSSSALFSQITWTQKLNFRDTSPYMHSDSLTGIKSIDISRDGDIFVLANYGQSNWEELYKVAANGSQIRWRIPAGSHGGLAGSFSNTVKATSDSGCILAFNWYGQSSWWHIDGVIQKYSKDGILQWSQSFQGFPPSPQSENEAMDVSQVGNNYYAQIGDTVVTIDGSGNISHYDSSQVFPIKQMPNLDLIVTSPSLGLARLDPSGNVIWSSTISGSCSCPSIYYYTHTLNSVSKIDLADGTIAWTRTYPLSISNIDMTADSGFVASYGTPPHELTSICACAGPGTIFRADANGDTLWSRSYDFPYYGLPCIRVHPSGNLITGGAFLFTNKEHTFFARDFSSFVCSLDSAGHGTLETTDLTWPGDANNNQVVSFVDDALYVGIANGSTGTPRDTVDWDYSLFSYMPGTYSDYASDWTGAFAGGVNYKHADFNGDGMIDPNDLTPYTIGYYFPFSIPAWRIGDPENSEQTVADFRLLAENDTIAPGAIIRYFIVAGTSATPVDSLYGVVLTCAFDYTLLADSVQVSFNNSDLGTPGIDLSTYSFPAVFPPGTVNLYACRNDGNNVYQLNDTIGELTMTTSSGITSPQTMLPVIASYNALTYNQSQVFFNIIEDPVLIDPFVGLQDEAGGLPVGVFPNPADHQLTINRLKPNSKIVLFDLIGTKFSEFITQDEISVVKTDHLPNGFYTGTVTTEHVRKSFSFVVRHD